MKRTVTTIDLEAEAFTLRIRRRTSRSSSSSVSFDAVLWLFVILLFAVVCIIPGSALIIDAMAGRHEISEAIAGAFLFFVTMPVVFGSMIWMAFKQP